MLDRVSGTSLHMADKQGTRGAGDGRDVVPSTNQPLHGERRPTWTPILGVVLMVVVVLGIFALITWLRYTT